MTRQQLLDLYFLEARHQLVEIAAFLDRLERTDERPDFRAEAFARAVQILSSSEKNKTSAVLTAFSDPTTEPIFFATTKAASGAWPGQQMQA